MMFFNKKPVEFSSLKGKVIERIVVGTYLGQDAIKFMTKDKSYIMTHDQECCEDVSIEDICGDLNGIIGEEVLVAADVENDDDAPNTEKLESSYTWTFYQIRTFHGDITIRWFGTSSGYYSESVGLYEIDDSDGISLVVSKIYGKD